MHYEVNSITFIANLMDIHLTFATETLFIYNQFQQEAKYCLRSLEFLQFP